MEEKTKKKVGRKLAKIDEEQVLKLASMQCTNAEIAAFFDVDTSTVTKRFSQVIAKGKEIGKISLRRLQFRHAEKSYIMAIWLGKQYLDQKEPVRVVVDDSMKDEEISILSQDEKASRRNLDQYIRN